MFFGFVSLSRKIDIKWGFKYAGPPLYIPTAKTLRFAIWDRLMLLQNGHAASIIINKPQIFTQNFSKFGCFFFAYFIFEFLNIYLIDLKALRKMDCKLFLQADLDIKRLLMNEEKVSHLLPGMPEVLLNWK